MCVGRLAGLRVIPSIGSRCLLGCALPQFQDVSAPQGTLARWDAVLELLEVDERLSSTDDRRLAGVPPGEAWLGMAELVLLVQMLWLCLLQSLLVS